MGDAQRDVPAAVVTGAPEPDVGRPPDARPVDEPYGFRHDLDAAGFDSDRLDHLCREAARRGQVKLQAPDTGRERRGQDPTYLEPRYPVLEDAATRGVHYRIFNADGFDPEVARSRDRVFELAGPDPVLGRTVYETVIRIFSPGALVALHGDPDSKLVCAFTGQTTWHVRPPAAMTLREHEDLLRGGFFLPWRDVEEQALRLGPGDGCHVPARWAHWLDHPTDEPIVSYEMGFWTHDSLRERKVYDVNWMLRRLRLHPAPPGGSRDGLKVRAFDAAAAARRRVRRG